jgi:hypothetical protein
VEATASSKRGSLDGSAYTHLFPAVSGRNETIKKQADLGDTMQFIPKAVQATLFQTEKIAPVLRGHTLRHTCSKIWHFLYGHCMYLKDEENTEQIRSPARAWRDRQQGIDCDCFSVFISSILTNLGIKHLLRITKYKGGGDKFQHIYPIVPCPGGYITMDCVTNYFDYEVPFSEKKDYDMELQFLNGFGGSGTNGTSVSGLSALGRILQKKEAQRKAGNPFRPGALKKNIRNQRQPLMQRPTKNAGIPAAMPPPQLPGTYSLPAEKKKKFGGRLLNKVNKINPATVLLRNGILASMKLNIRNVAGRLRWSYLSPQQAAAKEIDPEKFQKIVAARMRLEKIFFGAGGKPDNLRKAMLAGKGNKDRAVNGLEGLDGYVYDVAALNEYTPMPALLGLTIYHDENISGMEGFGSLGEPLTMSSIAAASAVIAGIAGMIKEVGSIFKRKNAPGAADFDEKVNDAAEKAAPIPPPGTATPPFVSPVDTADTPPVNNAASQQNAVPAKTGNDSGNTAEKEAMPGADKTNAGEGSLTTTNDTGNGNSGGNPATESFWDKNKSWIKPVGIGLGSLAILGLAYSAMQKDEPGKPARPQRRSNGTLAGPGNTKNHHRGGSRRKYQHMKAVGLQP